MKNKLFAFFAMFFLIFTLAACGSNKEIKLSATTLTMEVGQTVNLDTLIVDEAVKEKDLTWTSSDKSIVIVASSSAAQGKALGTADITLSTKGYKDAKITITVAPVIKLEVNSTKLCAPGEDPVADPAETYQITATANPTSPLTYTSNKTSVATVDDKGKVTAVAPGTAEIEIKATSTGATAKFTVTVEVLNTDPTDVTFKLTLTEALPKDYINIYLVGNIPDCVWTPAHPDFKLTKVDDLHYSINVKNILPRGELAYKYTLGTVKTQGNWSFAEIKPGGGDRIIKLNGGKSTIEDTNYPWESTNVPDPSAAFIAGDAFYTFSVLLPTPLANGEFIRLVGDFGDFKWTPKATEMNLVADSENPNLYSLNIWEKFTTFKMEGGQNIPYKFIIGNAASCQSTEGWDNLLHEIGRDSEANNFGVAVDGGIYVLTHTVTSLKNEGVLIPKVAAEVVRTNGFVTINITASEGLTAGTEYFLAGADPVGWKVNNTAYKLTETEGVFTITIKVPYSTTNFEFKIVTVTGWSKDNIKVPLDNPIINFDAGVIAW